MRCKMTLAGFRGDSTKPVVELPLEENAAPDTLTDHKVYTHFRYRLRLSGLEEREVKGAKVYINDEPAGVQWRKIGQEFEGSFPSLNDGRIFRDCFGFAGIAVLLSREDGMHWLRSGGLPVMVRRDALTASVQAMAEYVYERQEAFLFSGKASSRVQRGLRKGGRTDPFARLALAEEITDLFEASYPYFKANCRFQIQKTPTVQPLERLQYIAPVTLQYAACHPEELQPAAGSAGIRSGRRVYQPRRAMGLVNQAVMDTYENRILLGFLKTLLEAVRRMRNGGAALREAARERQEGEWTSSPCFLLAPLRPRLEETHHPLRRLESRLARLLRMYSRLLPIDAPRLCRAPKPTALFRSVPEYHRMFACCCRWFQFGLYGSGEEKQRYLLPFLRVPDLYEVYFLARLFDCLEKNGWHPGERLVRKYPRPQNWRRPAEDWPAAPAFGNVFPFQKDGVQLTVFYQPVIYSGKDPAAHAAGVGLYRNTSLSCWDGPDTGGEETAARAYYYLPDFVLKLQRGAQARFVVADAKFSNRNRIERYQLPSLAYKYLFALSPLRPEDTLEGLCILCGQCGQADAALSDVRDCLPPGQNVRPFANVMYFPGGAEDEPLLALLNRLTRE